MRILWHSNAAWAATGYGNQTAVFVPRLQKLGHDVAVSAFYGLHGQALDWEGIRHFPGLNDAYGNDVLQAHAMQHFGGDQRAGLVLTLLDVWVLAPQVIRSLDVASWVPVDHQPAPPAVKAYFEQAAAIPIAMSRFGETMLREHDPLYVPHGINTHALRPGDREQARAKLGLPGDAFVVGMVAANKGNPSRKSFDETFQAFARLLAKHRDAVLYLHTEATGAVQGVDLPRLLAACDIPPQNVRFTDQYAYTCLPQSTAQMADVYRAMDVLCNPAQGEGFGVPMLEAQACGIPVITTDTTACPEVGKVGWHVPGQAFWSTQMSWQVRPDVGALTDAMLSAYDMAGRLSGQAREHALTYDADLVAEVYWKPALAEIASRLEDRRPRALGLAA